MVLTDRQKAELHCAIGDYLLAAPGFADVAIAFLAAAGLGAAACSSDGKAGALERKWTAVLRLQKKVTELEARVQQMAEDAVTADRVARGAVAAGDASDFLPRAGAAHVLTGHRKPVTCVALHPRFNIAVSGGEDASLRVWDLDAGVAERSMLGHTNAVADCAFDPQGGLLASCGADMSIKLWDFGGGGGGGTSGSAAAAAAGGGGSSAGALGTPTYVCVRTLLGHEHVVSGVAFVPPLPVAPAGSSVLSPAAPSTAAAAGGGMLSPGPTASGPSGGSCTTLVSCSRDGSIGVWDIASGHCRRRLRGGHTDGAWVRRLAVAANAATLASCSSDHSVVVWELATGKVKRTLFGHENVVECLALSTPAGEAALRRALAAGGGGGGADGGSAASSGGAGAAALATPTRPTMTMIGATAVSASASPLTPVAGGGGTPTFATPTRGSGTAAAIATTPGSASTAAATASGGGAFVATGSRDKTARVWDAATGREVATFPDHESWVRGVAFHPNGVWLVTACEDRCVRVYDIATKRLLRRVPDAAPHFLSCLAVRPRCSAGPPLVVTGSVDCTLQVFDCR